MKMNKIERLRLEFLRIAETHKQSDPEIAKAAEAVAESEDSLIRLAAILLEETRH